MGFTREQFGAKVGVDKMTVYRWENGTRRPNEADMKKVNRMRDSNASKGVVLSAG